MTDTCKCSPCTCGPSCPCGSTPQFAQACACGCQSGAACTCPTPTAVNA